MEYSLSTGVIGQSCALLSSVYATTLCPNIQAYLCQLFELPVSVGKLHCCALLFHTIHHGDLQQFIRASGIRPKQLIGAANFNSSSLKMHRVSVVDPIMFSGLFVSVYNCSLIMEARCMFLVTLVNRVCSNCNQRSDHVVAGTAGVIGSSAGSTDSTTGHCQWQLRRLLCSDLQIVSLLLRYLPLVSVKLKTDMVWCLCSIVKLTPLSAL